jgi:TrmH family RNA methyltransferase
MNLSQSELKYLRSLQQKKYRDSEQKFLLEGWRPLSDALHSDFLIEFIAITKETLRKSEHQSLIKLAEERRIPIKELKEIQLKQVSDTVHSQGIVALIRQKNEILNVGNLMNAGIIVACDRINDPGNLGTILRTCDWFGVDGVMLNENCVSLYNEKVVRSTAGSIFHLKIFENVNLVTTLPDFKSSGFKVLATTLEGKSVFTTVLQDKMILLLGSEAHGLDPELTGQADEVVSIPRFGEAESLNVGIACGVLLAQWRSRSNKG